MARTVITVNVADTSGLNPTMATLTAADGGEFSNGGLGEIVKLDNPTGGSITATFPPRKDADGYTLQNVQVTVPAGEVRYVGNLLTKYMNGNDGKTHVDVSADGLGVGVIRS